MAGKRPTLRDIANVAGVGTATVERVLNDRGMVTPTTAERVIRAAKALGVRRELPTLYRTPRRAEIILVQSEALFYQRLEHAFMQTRSTIGRDLVLYRSFVPEADAAAFKECIERASASRHGLIVFAPATPEVAAAIEHAVQRGLPVVTLITRVATKGRTFHVGIDQYAAGRTAAHFLGGLARRPGPVVVVTGRLSVSAHIERLAGFRDVLAARFPHLTLDTVIEGRDEAERTEALLRDYLFRNPRPVGVYDTASTYRVIGSLLAAFGLAGSIPFIAHEITPETIELLRSHVITLVMDQHPELHTLRAVQILLHELGYSDVTPDTAAIPFSIVTPENLPSAVDRYQTVADTALDPANEPSRSP